MVKGGRDREHTAPRTCGFSGPVMWKLAQDDLSPLEQVCREELAREQAGGGT